jgi:5,10-methylenetetrahydromethanopterin reductase
MPKPPSDQLRISLASLGEEPTPRFTDQVRLAELVGYNAFFHADEKWTRDVYVRLAAAATLSERIGLGISVTDPFTRHPALTAQATATLAELCEGRLRVIMGVGSHFETLPGYGVRKGPRAMREAIEVMRGLWAGERVTFDGEIVKLDGAKFDFDPQQVPPVYIAGRGPLALKSAGWVADGALVGSFATEPGLDYAKDRIEAGLEKSGRSWDDMTLASWLYVSILDEEDEEIPDNVRRGVSHALWSSRAFFKDRLDDFADDITPEFRAFMNDASHEWSPEVMAELRSLIPRGIFDSLSVVGTEEQVIERFRRLRAAGVDECVIWPFPRAGEEVEDLLLRIGRTVVPAVGKPMERAGYRLVD